MAKHGDAVVKISNFFKLGVITAPLCNLTLLEHDECARLVLPKIFRHSQKNSKQTAIFLRH